MTQVDWRGRTLNILSWVILIAVLAPEWWAFFKSEAFVFVNGWDEETYLSWQGVLGAKDRPGYYVSYLNLALHNFGISGAIQNLIFDTVFFPITVYLVYASFSLAGFGADRKFSYALIVCLSSVIFNYANPIISFILGPYDAYAIVMAGHEYYPTVLRTPNPQVSYLLVALAVYLFMRFRRPWIFIIPLPFLYYYVAIPYVFFVSMYFTSMFLASKRRLAGYKNYFVSFFGCFLIASLGLVVLFAISGLYQPDNYIRQNSYVFFETRLPQFPLVIILLGSCFCILFWFGLIRIDRTLYTFLAWLGLAAGVSVNIHLVTGFMLSQKNYYDYGLSVLFGIGLVVMIELLQSERVRYGTLVACLGLVAYLSFQSQLRYARYAISMSPKMVAVLEHAKQDPLHSIIPDLAVSSLVAYSTPKLFAPPFSYLYYFKFIAKQCVYYETLLDNAVRYSEGHLSEKSAQLKSLEETTENIEKGRFQQRSVPYVNRDYCEYEVYNDKSFVLLPPQ